MVNIVILVILFSQLFCELLCEISCKSETNKNLDWFIAVKYPNDYRFVYFTSESSTIEWRVPKYSLKDERNMIGLTISQTQRARDNEEFYVYYNDHSPDDESNSYRGHLKGVLNFDSNNGFWMVHSVPKFPDIDRYNYGYGQTKYGQSFICISLQVDNLETIALQLLMMQATVYSHHLPKNFLSNPTLNKLLTKLAKNKKFKKPKSKIVNLKTNSGYNFIHLGKSRKFNRDLYSDLVAPTLKSSLFVESWIRGSKLESNCSSTYKVYNVEDLKLLEHQYTETKDHSKWAVSENGDYFCVGDINRMESQFVRGGGTLCFRNGNIWKLVQKIIKEIESCPYKKEGQ